jgi:hypothetical protein
VHIINKKFWKELISCFPFTVILLSDTGRKKTLVCMHNEVNKASSLGGCGVGITDGSDL